VVAADADPHVVPALEGREGDDGGIAAALEENDALLRW
jgi:hypothetical protein